MTDSLYYGRVSALLSALNTRPTLMYCFDTSTSHSVPSSPVSLCLPLCQDLCQDPCQDLCQDQSCKRTHTRALPLLKEPNSGFTFKNLLKIDIMQFSDCEIFADLRLQLYLGWTPRTCEPRSCGGGLTPRSTDTTRTSAQTITR